MLRFLSTPQPVTFFNFWQPFPHTLFKPTYAKALAREYMSDPAGAFGYM